MTRDRSAEAGPDLLAFTREPGFLCIVNVSATPASVPAPLLEAANVLLASHPLEANARIPADTAVWYSTS